MNGISFICCFSLHFELYHQCPMHPAPRRADYERVFVGVNSDADIISGALFKLSGTLFRVPETRKVSGPLFLSAGPN